MSEIDVRVTKEAPIEYIRFADENPYNYTATRIKKGNRDTPDGVSIEEDDGGEGDVAIHSKEHGENLIKALQKAIELGWLK